MIGKKLAHYEIVAKIGEGGMGEVFRAKDTHLNREVALKILPHEVAENPERAARFEREAVTLASLQHPNIASIYGYEKAEGTRFLAMELVEGEDLSVLLKRGALSVDEVVRIAGQIALGLEAAHERGIVHRDLKPANVRINPEGAVKILDFGLAQAYSGDSSSQYDVQSSPTLTAAMTMAGVILGTASYMSPEQARGKRVDKRSDIWAFGVILYEMLLGSPLYSGETVTDILGAIVHSEPDLSELPDKTPAGLRTLIKRCLTSEAQDRLRDIGEARYALAHLDAFPTEAAVIGKARASSRGWLVASLVLLLAVVGVTTLWLQAEPDRPVVQASIGLPNGTVLRSRGSAGGAMRFSPDGKSLAFVVQSSGKQQIWVRSLDEREGRPVQGTEGGHRPFWSPDGKSLGFFAMGSMRRVSVSGGAPLTIAPANDGRGGSWLADGTIVFAPTPGSGLFGVAAAGGEPRQVTDQGKYSHREPRVVGDNGDFLFLENRSGGVWMVCLGNVDGRPHRDLTTTTGGAEYASGQLLFLRGTTLVAQPCDPGSGQLSGEAVPLAEGIVRDADYGIGAFSVSRQGDLAYQTDRGVGSELTFFDRAGDKLAAVGEPEGYSQVALSPDNTRIVALVDEADGGSDFWIISAENGSRQRFTFTPANEGARRSQPVWAPDGSRIYYSLEKDGLITIHMKQTDGGGAEEKILEIPGHDIWSYDISQDGQWLLFGIEKEDSNEDLWIYPLTGDGEPRPLFETPFDEWPGSFSPDGRWLAVDSDESGRREIYVIPFPDGSGKWQVSRAGGRFPRWNADGSELFFQDPEGGIMVVPMDLSGDKFSAGEPQLLFRSFMMSGSMGDFAPCRAGDRLLVVEQSAQEAPISLFLNWMDALATR
jgi:eukaryotic-like serine/threonine-protein kinase